MSPAGAAPPVPDSQRIDRWLWTARFFKTRILAQQIVSKGRIRITVAGQTRLVAKPSHPVRPGDVLTFPQGARIRVVKVLGLAERRGPASFAGTLFEDLS